jgi:RNA-directed DNA polymerase
VEPRKAMRQTIRGWHLQLKSDKSLADLSAMFDPILRGWRQYYGRFYGSALGPVWRSMNMFLIRWLMRKHRHLAAHKTRAAELLKRTARSQPDAFIHWSLGWVSSHPVLRGAEGEIPSAYSPVYPSSWAMAVSVSRD